MQATEGRIDPQTGTCWWLRVIEGRQAGLRLATTVYDRLGNTLSHKALCCFIINFLKSAFTYTMCVIHLSLNLIGTCSYRACTCGASSCTRGHRPSSREHGWRPPCGIYIDHSVVYLWYPGFLKITFLIPPSPQATPDGT